jgi:hypothetical protein
MGCGGGKGQATAPGGGTRSSTSGALPPSLASAPMGRFNSALPPLGEGRRDFARIFFADERKIFLMAKGMPGMRPLQPTTGPSSAHIGDMSEEVVARAETLFTESLTRLLSQAGFTSAPDPHTVDILRSRATAAMTVNVGMDFALHMKLMPTFLQPFFLIVVLGEPLEARAATYGFVAEKPQQIAGDRPESKRTPFCVRLLSPNLLGASAAKCVDAGDDWEVQYNARVVQASSIMQAVEMEMPKMRDATAAGSWDVMLK